MATTGVRERGLRLQRRVTVAVVAGSTALAGVFAGVAAATAPGHKVVGGSASSQQPSLPAGVTAQAPVAPSQVPSPTQLPPVASSGGS